MSLLKHHIVSVLRALENRKFYFDKKEYLKGYFQTEGYSEIRAFNINKWHHNLYLFTAKNSNGEAVFIKLTDLGRVLKNEDKAYKKLQKDTFLKAHLIEHKEFIKKEGYKALVLKRADGIVLNEKWAIQNISKLHILVKIVDKFQSLGLVHRDIKLDNFIYENEAIKIFDFSFMIDKTTKEKLKEVNLSDRGNILKLVDLGIHYKPEPLLWDDYYSLYIVFTKLLKNNSSQLTSDCQEMLTHYIKECKAKIGSNSYTILR